MQLDPKHHGVINLTSGNDSLQLGQSFGSFFSPGAQGGDANLLLVKPIFLW
jgi:hypothetical protein